MNRFDQLKQEMILRYGHVNQLPFFHRLLARFCPENQEVSLTVEEPIGQFTQFAVLINYRGKEYIKRFGKLF